MPDLVRGLHHYVDVATFVTEAIFHILKTRNEAQGGSLSIRDLDVAHVHFLTTLPKVAEYLDGIERQHMKASGATAPEYFARETILVTLLTAYCHKGTSN